MLSLFFFQIVGKYEWKQSVCFSVFIVISGSFKKVFYTPSVTIKYNIYISRSQNSLNKQNSMPETILTYEIYTWCRRWDESCVIDSKAFCEALQRFYKMKDEKSFLSTIRLSAKCESNRTQNISEVKELLLLCDHFRNYLTLYLS